jgi:hypothetical protein
MIQIVRTILAVLLVSFIITCSNKALDNEKKESNILAASLIYQSSNLQILQGSFFALNGSWNSFTGNATTANTQTTINARYTAQGGVWLDDGNGYSTCTLITTFDNNAGYVIVQNPQNNGACFTGDTNKGKYFKIVYFADSSVSGRYWYCYLNATSAASSVAAAIAISDTSSRTNPGTSGCSGFSWSRLDKR